MPLFNFHCPKCDVPVRLLLDSADQAQSHKKCGETLKRVLGAASSQAMEVLDNGIQPRRVERYAEAERIFKEREWAHDQKYKRTDVDDE